MKQLNLHIDDTIDEETILTEKKQKNNVSRWTEASTYLVEIR